jgi:pimeloyl-ACP methyl ester carboxylesterase
VRVQVVEAGPAWAVLLHGFTRSGRHLAGLAEQLAERGISSVRPDLGSLNWFRSVNNARYLDRVAADLRAIVGSGAVIVGHSAGAAAAGYLAPRLVDCAGVVFVDGVENPTHHIERNWPALRAMPVVAVCAPPSACNRSGRLAQQLAQWGFTGAGCVVDGAGHGDIEDGDPSIYRLVCRSSSTPQTKALVRDLVVWSVCDLLHRPPEMVNPWNAAAVHPSFVE